MLTDARRSLLVIVLLFLAVGAVWGLRWARGAGRFAAAPSPTADPGVSCEPASVFFADIEGWYRITPYETALLSPYDWTAGSTQALGAALPATVEGWEQVGRDQDVSGEPSIVQYLGHPSVALRRVYAAPDGLSLTLSVIGNQGDDSFLLFSHTPETCYPGRLWRVVEARREAVPIDERPMHVQSLLLRHAETGDLLLVLYWYLWDNPERDVRGGVLSVRVNLVIPPGHTEEAVLARARQFVRALFPATAAWSRF